MAYLFSFKKKIQDFVVDEQLPLKLAEEGEFLYIQIQKEGKTTLEIIDFLIKSYKLPKNAIGFAGLKDKHGITSQRLSFDAEEVRRSLRSQKFEKVLCVWLSTICKVLKTGRYRKALTTKDDLENRFTILLRSNKTKLFAKDREIVEWVFTELLATNNFPNYFGEQRFGIKGRNVDEGKRILSGDKSITWFDRLFKLQAYSSHLFNLMLAKRIEDWNKLIDWDLLLVDGKVFAHSQKEIFEQADRHEKKHFLVSARTTWTSIELESRVGQYTFGSKKAQETKQRNIVLPVLGYNTLIPNQDTEFGKWFHGFLRKYHVNWEDRALYQELKIYGILRPIWINTKKPSWKRVGDDIVLKFGLPAGSYASVIVDQLMKRIDEVFDNQIQKPEIPYDQLPQHQQKRTRKTHRKGKAASSQLPIPSPLS
jgi:tRNA(Glu) U13 pseudouridine synthase TruD